MHLTKTAVALLALALFPLAAQAQTLYNDPFTEYNGTGYNFGTGSFNSTTPPYTEFTTNSGGPDSIDGLPGYTNQKTGTDILQAADGGGNSTDTIATITGATINSVALGKFVANTTYTFTVLATDSAGATPTTNSASIEILNGGASSGVTALGSILATYTDSMLATGQQSTFLTYTATFNDASMPSVVGDYIQLAFEDTEGSGGNQSNIDFDNPTLTASADPAPEPSTFALAGLVVGVMVFAVRRSKSRLTSPLAA